MFESHFPCTSFACVAKGLFVAQTLRNKITIKFNKFENLISSLQNEWYAQRLAAPNINWRIQLNGFRRYVQSADEKNCFASSFRFAIIFNWNYSIDNFCCNSTSNVVTRPHDTSPSTRWTQFISAIKFAHQMCPTPNSSSTSFFRFGHSPIGKNEVNSQFGVNYLKLSVSISPLSVGWLLLTRDAFALINSDFFFSFRHNFHEYGTERLVVMGTWAGMRVWIAHTHVTSNLLNDRSRHCSSLFISATTCVCVRCACVEKFGGNRFMCQFELLSK